MDSNSDLLKRLFDFSRKAGKINPNLASCLQRSLPELVEYPRDLGKIRRSQLLKITGIGEKTVGYIQRILSGEEIDSVLNDVPQLHRTNYRRRWNPTPRYEHDNDGSWDNAVERLEENYR